MTKSDMLDLTLKCALGIILLTISIISLIANIIVATPVFSFVIAKDKSSIYVLAAVNIIHDFIQMMITITYLAPGIITDSYIFSDSRESALPKFFGTIFVICWNVGNATQILTAINRVSVIFYRQTNFFSKRNLMLVYIPIVIISIIKVYISQYIFPCCSFIIDQGVYSYSFVYKNDTPNYMDSSEMPLNIVTSLTTFICYSLIFKHIRESRKTIETTLGSSEQKMRRNREFTYALQFSFISFPYTFGWILFRLFPLMIQGRGIEWYYVTAVANTCNCSGNAFIYLVSNAEVKKYLKEKGPVFSFVVAKDKSSIYVLAAVNIIHDVTQLLIVIVYLAPSIIADSHLFSGDRESELPKFFGTIFVICWNVGNITQILTAINRVTVIFYRQTTFFTKRNLILIYIPIVIISIIKVYISQYIFPCCSFIIDQSVYSCSFVYKNNTTNYMDISEMPLNIVTSLTTIICYSLIFKHIRVTRKTIATSFESTDQKMRRNREFSYALQFFFISIPYALSWIFFRIFPLIVQGKSVEWYYIIAVAYICNCTTNAFIYLVSNAEVKKQIREKGICCVAGKQSLLMIVSASGSSVVPKSNPGTTFASPT
ncbi:unnamed protein product [Caenorhabditis angaria]|uniref:G-protein coupled receptors family 1 profile domain-containing protein n=1 Tax=Caenorhabditis angaria TaxID=860376 RepID=A0A9P1IXM3_9PELO|nr:unnamed protein product [Caenorhabditis angaria]